MSERSEIRKEFWKTLSDSPNLMVNLQSSNEHSVPMRAHLDKDADGEFWFYTSRTNRLAAGGAAMAQFASKGHDLFACISGVLSEETDEAVIDRYWNNAVAAWYDRGREDPDMLMLRFNLAEAEIWTADMSIKGAFKMMAGIKIKESESGDHAKLNL